MVVNKQINVYRVHHMKLTNEGWLVMADTVKDAIRTFMEFHAADYDIDEDGITGVVLEKQLDILVDNEIFTNKYGYVTC